MTTTMTLGDVIKKLEQQPEDNWIRYDFGFFVPDLNEVGSYRGYYDHLSIGFTDDRNKNDIRVKDVLKALRYAVGHIYKGYKGGEYMMDLDTPLWVANYSHCHDTGIIGIDRDGVSTIIETGYCVY